MTTGRGVRRLVRDVLLAAAGGLAVLVLIGGPAGVLLGCVAGTGLNLWLARQPTRQQVALRRRVSADLPYAADLLAAVLRAGSPPAAATRAVGEAVAGPVGERLVLVGRALRLGEPSGQAWHYLAELPGAARLAQVAARGEYSGAAVAQALQRLAADMRTGRATTATAAAARAGVLIVLPLGLCFLPAFVLAGIVPVIIAVLGAVLSR
jgi:pilus assembly protein TadC